MNDIVHATGYEIIHGQHGMTLSQEPVTQMRTQESSPASYQYAHNSYSFNLLADWPIIVA